MPQDDNRAEARGSPASQQQHECTSTQAGQARRMESDATATRVFSGPQVRVLGFRDALQGLRCRRHSSGCGPPCQGYRNRTDSSRTKSSGAGDIPLVHTTLVILQTVCLYAAVRLHVHARMSGRLAQDDQQKCCLETQVSPSRRLATIKQEPWQCGSPRAGWRGSRAPRCG